MATVYYWALKGTSNLGHLSIKLSNGTYISYWPKDHSIWKRGSAQSPTLENDISLEGRPPDQTLPIPSQMINEALIVTWWKKYLHSSTYNLVGNNCGQVVRRALVEGGIEETIPWYHKYIYKATKSIHAATLTPHDCLAWIKYILEIHGSFFRWS